MIPVEQQVMAVFDEHGDNLVHGDCLRAALASLFELPLDEVPHFVEHDDWWNQWMAWLEERGLRIATAFCKPDPEDPTRLNGWPGDVYWLATVKSPRGKTRCCVCNGDRATLRDWDDELSDYVEHETPQPCRRCDATGLEPSLHSVVMFGRDIVWDPHPQRHMGHLGFVCGYEFRAIDPARLQLRAA